VTRVLEKSGIKNKRPAMKILLADDDPVTVATLATALQKWGYEPVVCADGNQAWQWLQHPDAPLLVILDWDMPGLTGLELSRLTRERLTGRFFYIILISATFVGTEFYVEGLVRGADDYMLKPVEERELRARLIAGERIIKLQQDLAGHVAELERALAEVKALRGLIPICSYCKKVRADRGYWEQVEVYLAERTEAQFSHSICPDCYQRIVKADLAAAAAALKPPSG
jgi:PleD family two-component response regulator